MARGPRINTTGVIFHVFARGNNREPVFLESGDFQRFLNNLDRYQDKLRYTLLAYCLLPNHFHLLLRPNKYLMSNVMQVLLTAYTMYFHKRYNRVGHIFQGRYKSIAVEKETYLLELIRYIHLNPVRAGIVESIEQYPWSSYLKYLTTGPGVPTVESSEVLTMYSTDPVKQKQLFIEFTIAGLGVDFDPEQAQIRGVLGSPRFVQEMTKVLRGVRP